MKKVLLNIKKRLYLYVGVVFLIALAAGSSWNFGKINIKPISIFAVFIMLYPMLTGLEIEKVRYASRNFKLIITTLIFAFFVASGTAFLISRTVLAGYPEIALAMVMVGAIPCSNMLIGWAGIADASVENALVIAVIGLMAILFISPVLIKLSGGVFTNVNLGGLVLVLLAYILVPLMLGLFTRHQIIKRKGKKYFMDIKKIFPGISAIGILIIIFFSVAKVARVVIGKPTLFLLVFLGLFSYYIIQTVLSVLTARLLKFNYEEGMIFILGATASSQAISLGVAATLFSSLTVFALSFKPILQVLYIMFLIYGAGPRIRKFLEGLNQ